MKRKLYITLLGLFSTIMAVAVPYRDVRKFSITDGLAANTIPAWSRAKRQPHDGSAGTDHVPMTATVSWFLRQPGQISNEWHGMAWMAWTGMEWTGMEWNGMECRQNPFRYTPKRMGATDKGGCHLNGKLPLNWLRGVGRRWVAGSRRRWSWRHDLRRTHPITIPVPEAGRNPYQRTEKYRFKFQPATNLRHAIYSPAHLQVWISSTYRARASLWQR